MKSCQSRARCSALWKGGGNPGFPKKKVLQWAGPGQDAEPCSLNRYFGKADFQQRQHTLAPRSGNDSIGNNQIDSRAPVCFTEKSKVEPTQKALQCRQFSEMGDRRAHLPQDRRGLPLHFCLCGPAKQCFTEIAKTRT